MKKALFGRLFLSLCVLLACVYILLPEILGGKDAEQKHAWSRFLPDTYINLGLDLKGGIHLTLGVDIEKALEANLTLKGQELLAEAGKEGLLISSPQLVGETLDFIFTLPAKRPEFESMLSSRYSEFSLVSVKELTNGRLRYQLGFTPEYTEKLNDTTLDQALTTIRSRIDQFGVAEPDIRKQQGGQITVQLPGLANSDRAIEIIGKTAHLEFRIVADANSKVPTEKLPYMSVSNSGKAEETTILVEKAVVLTGDHIESAQPQSGEFGSSAVSITFDNRGSEIFSRLTETNINRGLAIVLDGKVHSAPTIRARLSKVASITGNFTHEEANDLALILRSGSLPAPVKILEERSVGPSLGQESITMGVKAALVGWGAVILFMTTYYGLSGIIANVMLFFDLLLVLAGMSLFGATLTLPGIAGIVLTIGMAVDANVLIFERIREELKIRATAMEAVELGFNRATLAIVDSNLTTIIAALILYQFGTGPVKGFAVTLTLGILASMFTAIFVSRGIFYLWASKPTRTLSI